MRRFGDQAAGGCQAQGQGVSAGWHAMGGPEQGFKTAGGKANFGGDAQDGQGGIKRSLHDRGCAGDAGVKCGVKNRRGKLGVGSGMDGGKKAGGDLPGERCAMAGADQVQHEIGGGGGTGNGYAVSVYDKTLRDHVNLGVGGSKVFQILPMHRGAVTIQQACTGQHPRGRVNATNKGKAWRKAAQIADQGAGGDVRKAISCDDDQGIGTDGIGKRAGGGEFNAAG
jgi:hypothetical protein